MIDLITKIINLLEKLNTYFQKRYPKDTGILLPAGVKRSQFVRLWEDISKHLLLILSTCLMLLTAFRIWLVFNYYIFLYKINSNEYPIFTQLFSESKIALSFTILLFVTFTGLVLISTLKRQGVSKILLMGILLVVSLVALTNPFEKKIENYVKAEAYYYAYQKFFTGEYQTATDVFDALIFGASGEDIGFDIERVVAQSNYQAGNIKDSVSGFAELVAKGKYSEQSGEVVLLHTAIYALGKAYPLDDALAFLDDLRNEYNIKELSPLWLGIDQQENLHFIWDYVSDFEVNPEDRIILRILIAKYPNDYYADLARFAIGEYQSIADNSLSSPFRDWCLYRTAQDAYVKMDFPNSIKYYLTFLKEFPNHRWTDDAIYRLARSYDLSGDYNAALQVLLLSENYPDGDRMKLINAYRIALIDYYFDAEGLKKLIANYRGNWNYLPILEYSLAEQYFKQGDIEDAGQEFHKIELNYPHSKFSQYAERQMNLINKLLTIKSDSGNNWPINWAKLIMQPYDAYGEYNQGEYEGTSSLYVYNDLYDGNRRFGLSLIGWSGADWKYYNQSNDYLWAANLLQRECGQCTNQDEALYLQLLAYYNLTYINAFIPEYNPHSEVFGDISTELSPDDYSSNLVLDQLEHISLAIVNQYPNSIYAPEALSIAAVGNANYSDFEKSVELMNLLLSLYPNSTIANNASIFIARTYYKLAQDTYDNNNLKLVYYSRAKKAYELTIDVYPSGHVGKEAMDELGNLLSEMSEVQK